MSLTLSGDGTLTGVDADASGLLSELGGIGSNVVSTTKTDRFTTSSTSLTDITGLSVTITPTSATSKVLVLYSFTFSTGDNDSGEFQLIRDSTNIAVSTGAAVTNQTEVDFVNLGAVRVLRHAGQFLDSPATTSATTYKLAMRMTSGTGAIGGDGNRGAVASITAIEVAA